MRIELEVACRLARYCCDVMNSSHGGIPLQARNRLSLKMAVAAPIADTQGQHKFVLRLSCWPPFEPRNPAEGGQVATSARFSALGQKQTSQGISRMSALPPKADIGPLQQALRRGWLSIAAWTATCDC